MYQQGDVILLKTDKVQGKKLNHLIVAYGEATGHHHRVTTGEATLYEHEGTLFLRVDNDTATITHEEHITQIVQLDRCHPANMSSPGVCSLVVVNPNSPPL